NMSFALFRTVKTPEEAKPIFRILESGSIEYKVVENSESFDITFAGNTTFKDLQILIPQDQFEKAEVLFVNSTDAIVNDVDQDYFLFEFSNEELYDVLLKQDEWGPFNYSLSKKILTERGEDISQDFLLELKERRINDLSNPDDILHLNSKNIFVVSKMYVILGYLSSLLGGVLGIIMGYAIWTNKKTLPNGNRVPVYSKTDQRHGRIMFFMGVIVLIIAIITYFNNLTLI
ncbi:MAG: hypothetical protein CL823_02740, partial [Crocinitomicaceae bacterium]|nr:hypothetical protein [Crocinitomicaceae bacterium]